MAPKPLSEYPRPPEDNGRGVHWSASVYHPTGADLQFWIDELKAMQIKWVKLLDDGGGSSIELCQALLDNGIMPVVRVYRERPNPGRLGGREIDAIERLIQVGVRYFETNNEPDLPAEWENNHRPENWLDIVVENFIYDADAIQAMGGLPAFPAMGPGNKANGLAKVVERGRIDIFEKGAWLAIHNYTLNHPLDYPNDPVNQEGKPLTQVEYERLAAWQYSHLTWEEIQALGLPITREDYDKFNRWAWDGRTLEEINAVRQANKNPGATVFDDANCFRGWELFGHYMNETLGFHVPIISTEGGPVVGWGDDNRYAKVNPTTQADWQMQIVRFLQEEAPPWYFTVCTWLLASIPMGDFNPAWDQMSWFTHAWDLQFGLDGQLPIVQILKDTPARIRHELRPQNDAAAVSGLVTDARGQPLAGVVLELHDEQGHPTARDVSNARGHFELTAPPGVYDLYVPWWGIAARSLTLTPADVDVIRVPGIDPPGHYEISGIVQDEDGIVMPEAPVVIQRNGILFDRQETNALGEFTFQPTLAGVYLLSSMGTTVEVTVTPENPIVRQDLILTSPATMRYVVTEKRLLSPEETGEREMFFGKVLNAQGEGMNGIVLEMRWEKAAPDAQFPRTMTGSDPFKPDGYYEFIHTKGRFMIQVMQGDYESDVADGLETANVPGREGEPITYEVNFQLTPVGETNQQCAIRGEAPGGRVGQAVMLWRQGQRILETALNQERSFTFEELEPGVYDVELAGIGLIRTDLYLEGGETATIQFPLMGAIVGRVENIDGEQRTIKLVSETYGFVRHGEITQDGQYRFTNLPGGRYRIELDDDILTGLENDGQSVVEAPLLRGGMSNEKNNSRIVGKVHDANNSPTPNVTISLRFQGQTVATTESDANGQYRFEHLRPGVYEVAVGDEISVSNIVLDGENEAVVDLLYAPIANTPTKLVERYYLLHMADMALTPTLTRMVASWLGAQPSGAVGFSIAEAQFAQTVVLLGDGIPESVISLLQDAQCQLVDMRGDLLTLARLLRPTTT